jgi:ABC-2 type transport system permease protein
MSPLRLYFRYIGVSLRSQMQYRASFLMWALGMFVLTGIEFLGIWALFHRFGSLRDWTLPEVGLLYGIVNLSFSLAEGIGRGFDAFPSLVKSGDFDRVLLRPRSTALQIAGQEVQLVRIGRLLQAAIVLVWSAQALELAWTVPHIALLLFAIFGGACLFYGLFVLQATMAFWTIESLEIMNTVTYGGTETAQYPLDIYRPWFRRFFTVVIPLACTSFFPVQALLGRSLSPFHWLAPAVGILFLCLALQCWKLGVRHYCSTGS